MTPEKALNILNAHFQYHADQKLFETYHILPHRGKWHGDCDNYAMTFGWLVSGESWKTFLLNTIRGELRFTHVLSPRGRRHMVVEYDGMCYDNIQRKGSHRLDLEAMGYQRFWRYSPLWILLKLFLSYTVGFFVPQR